MAHELRIHVTIPLDGDAMSLPAPSYCQSRFAVKPVDPFVVRPNAFASNQGVQAPIAEAPPLARQFDQHGLQVLIAWLGFRFVVQYRA